MYIYNIGQLITVVMNYILARMQLHVIPARMFFKQNEKSDMASMNLNYLRNRQ